MTFFIDMFLAVVSFPHQQQRKDIHKLMYI